MGCCEGYSYDGSGGGNGGLSESDYVQYERTTAISIANSAVALINMDSVVQGTLGSISGGQFQATEAGLYIASAYVSHDGNNSAGIRRGYIQKNGGMGYPVPITVGTVDSGKPPNIEGVDITVTSPIINLAVNDTLGLYALQNSGGNKDVRAGAWLQVIKVG